MAAASLRRQWLLSTASHTGDERWAEGSHWGQARSVDSTLTGPVLEFLIWWVWVEPVIDPLNEVQGRRWSAWNDPLGTIAQEGPGAGTGRWGRRGCRFKGTETEQRNSGARRKLEARQAAGGGLGKDSGPGHGLCRLAFSASGAFKVSHTLRTLETTSWLGLTIRRDTRSVCVAGGPSFSHSAPPAGHRKRNTSLRWVTLG